MFWKYYVIVLDKYRTHIGSHMLILLTENGIDTKSCVNSIMS